MEPGGEREEPASGELRPLGWDEVLPPLDQEKPTGDAKGEASGALVDSQPTPRWQEPEIAWPIAVLTGFLGSAIGAKLGIPLAGTLLPLLLFAPLYLALVIRHRLLLAALTSLGWLVAIGAGMAGAVLEASFDEVAAVSPGALAFRDAQIRPWLESGVGDPLGSPMLIHFGLGLVVLLAARVSVGVLALGILAFTTTGIGAGLGWFATEALSMEPVWACLLAIPPHRALAFAGLLGLTAALADRRPLSPVAELTDHRRELLLAGAALFGLGILLEPLLVPGWGSWLAEAVG